MDFNEYDLRYQLAIYRIDGSDYVEAITPQMKVVDSYEPVTYSLSLTPNRSYQVVVWADFVKEGTTEDLHYNTSNFRSICVADGKKESEYLNDESEHNRTILVDYLMTDKDDQTPIHFTLEALDGETPLMTHDLKTDIPIQRNWLTTIIGNLFTVGDNNFGVSISENFDNNWTVGELWWAGTEYTPTEPAYDAETNTYSIKTKEEFMWLPNNIETMLSTHKGLTISIDNDIDMSGVNWKPIYTQANTEYTVKGNGHTLRNFTIDGQFGAVYEYRISDTNP